jgi:AcrR family transcriptional regulator
VGRRAVTKVLAGAVGIGFRGPGFYRASTLGTRAQRRQSALKAMLEVVGSVGYAEASLGMVARRSGLDRRSIDLWFEDKEGCFLTAFEAAVGEVKPLLADATRAEGSWLGQLRAGLGALLEFLDAEPDVGRALLVEIHAAGPRSREKWIEAMELASDFIDRAWLEGLESPSQIAPEAVVAGINAVLRAELSAGAHDGLRELLPQLMHFAVLPYFGDEVARAEMQAAQGWLE